MNNKILILISIIWLLFSCSSKIIHYPSINKVDAFERSSTFSIPSDRNKELLEYNAALFQPVIVNVPSLDELPVVAMLGEKIFLSIDLENKHSLKKDFTISLENSNFSNFKCFRILPLSNWYTEGNKSSDTLEYIPDALFSLNKTAVSSYSFDILGLEKVQLFLEMEGSEIGKDKIIIKLKSNGDSKGKEMEFPVNVIEDKNQKPKFNSIIFNQNNQQSGSDLVNTWADVGFTHLQVNYIPTIYFKEDGSPTGSVVNKTSNSTGFRNTAYPWVKKGGSILLFWESRYDKVAPLGNGEYLKPFTRHWYKAYKFLIEEQYRLLKLYEPTLTKDQIVIYLADEFRAVDVSGKTFKVNQLSEFSKFLERELSEFKTLVTYGYKSNEKSVELLSGIDIQVPHINLPQQAQLGDKLINPTKVYKAINNESKWMYSVEQGKHSSLERFRFLPMISVLHKYEGFSWYAFIDHSGSTWSAADGNRLDYSFFYHNDPSNAIYKYWNSRLKTDEYLSSSLRLKAIEKGLTNARILKFLINNKGCLSKEQQDKLNSILKILSEFDILGINKIQFSEEVILKCRRIEISLRLLQSELN